MPVDRVSFTSTQLQIADNLQRVQLQYNQAAEPATTGFRINTLSDDPSVISRVFSLRNQISTNTTYQNNINTVELSLNTADTELSQSTDVLQRAQDAALRANDPTVDASTRTEIGTQIDDLKKELLGYANAQLDNKYIFAGSKVTTQPFTGVGGTFNGNSSVVPVQVSSSVNIDSNLDGNQIFLGQVRTATGSDLATTLKNSDGVNLGVKVGDVITASGTVGATAVSSSLTVTGSTTISDIASFLQSSVRTAGDNTETAAVQGDGSIKVTSGVSGISNLQLNISGNTTFNTALTFPASITGAGGTGGSDALKFGNGEDVFDVLDDLKNAVLAGDPTAIATHLARLQTGINQINNGRAQVATRIQQSDAVQTFLQDDGVRLMGNLSDLQDVDATSAISTLMTRETALQLVFQTSSRFLQTINNLNLGS